MVRVNAKKHFRGSEIPMKKVFLGLLPIEWVTFNLMLLPIYDADWSNKRELPPFFVIRLAGTFNSLARISTTPVPQKLP